MNLCMMEGMSYRIMHFIIQMQTLEFLFVGVCEETLPCVAEREALKVYYCIC